MNDIILSGLLHLFALYNTKGKTTDRALSNRMISEYLSFHFGLKSVNESMELYDNLVGLYEKSDDINRAEITASLIESLKCNLTQEERILVVLRVMEILSAIGKSHSPDMEFRELADGFGIPDAAFHDMLAFITDSTETDNVKSLAYGGGVIRLLYFQNNGTLLFSFRGESKIFYNEIPVAQSSFLVWQGSGVVKNNSQKPLYRFNALNLYKTGDTGTQQLKLRGHHINFKFPEGDGGVHDFTFNLYGGELVAIMGGSGTGKSTLLSILNGSVTPQEGDITINGHPISDPKAKTLIGFVPQDDLLIEELTVYQNLLYTARLCFDGMDDIVLHSKVKSILHELGLEEVSRLKVGSPLNKYISGGQRKRLNIALELIREPNILFLDEPTSGLSSADALSVVNLLREQTYKGKLVITNIHQPSSDVFKMFDRLWILDTGGYPIYDGNPTESLTYFKKAAHVADEGTTECPTCGNIDIETIFKIIDEKIIDHNGILTDKRKKSPTEWNSIYREQNKTKEKTKIESLPSTNQQHPSILKQVWIFLKRNMLSKFTDRQWLLITLMEAPVLALICAILTHYSSTEGYSIMDNKNMVSYMFMSIIVVTFLGMSGSAEEIIKDRAILKREHYLNLSYFSYIFSKIIFLAGVVAIQTLLFILVGNGIMQIKCLFAEWWIILFITAMLASLTGLILSQWMKSVVAIHITIPILLIPQILLCGLVVHFQDLTPNSHTANVPVIGDVIPSRWSFEALAVTSYSDNDYEALFFDMDRVKYEAIYYERSFLHEMRSQLEAMNDKLKKGETADDNLAVLRCNLPRLMDKCCLGPYSGDWSYESLSETFSSAESILTTVSGMASDEIEKRVEVQLKERGKDGIVQLKKDNYNLQLEQYVVNGDTQSKTVLVHNHIVPTYGYIFIDPTSRNGRAPFYSSVKIIGNYEIPTLEFNIMILLMMSLVCICLLLLNLPERNKTIFKNVK